MMDAIDSVRVGPTAHADAAEQEESRFLFSCSVDTFVKSNFSQTAPTFPLEFPLRSPHVQVLAISLF